MVRHDRRVALCVDTGSLRALKLLKSLALLPNRTHVQQAKSGRETHWRPKQEVPLHRDPAHNTDGVVTLTVTPQTRHQPFRRFIRPKSKHDVQRSCCRYCRGAVVTSVCGAGMRPPAICMDHLSHDMFRDIESPYKHSTITEGQKPCLWRHQTNIPGPRCRGKCPSQRLRHLRLNLGIPSFLSSAPVPHDPLLPSLQIDIGPDPSEMREA